MYKKGIFIGRFQPFHKGHLRVIEKVIDDCEEVIIGIGSSGCAGSSRNPLDINEREEIISAVLEARKLDANIYSIEDVPDDRRWMEYLLLCDFDAIFSSNKWVLDIAQSVKKEYAYAFGIIDVKPLVDSKETCDISATKVRTSIADGNGLWKSMVPEEVRGIIEQKFMSRFLN